jgi:hypothetical protein
MVSAPESTARLSTQHPENLLARAVRQTARISHDTRPKPLGDRLKPGVVGVLNDQIVLVDNAGRANGFLRERESMAAVIRKVGAAEKVQNLSRPDLLAVKNR